MLPPKLLTQPFSHVTQKYIAPYKQDGKINKELVTKDLTQWKANKFGLFTPYKTIHEFGKSLAYPLAIPLVIAVAPVVAVLALATTTLGLMLAGAAKLLHSEEAKSTFFDLALFAGITTGISLAVALLGPIIAAIAIPATTLSFITRSASTIVSAAIPKKDEPESAPLALTP